jgi:hypothetical protein
MEEESRFLKAQESETFIDLTDPEVLSEREAEALNTLMLMGLAARVSASAYISRIDTYSLFDIPSQELYSQVLIDVQQAGLDRIRDLRDSLSAFHNIYDAMYEYRGHRQQTHPEFNADLNRILQLRHKIFNSNQDVTSEERTDLVIFDIGVRRVGEAKFIDICTPYALGDELPPRGMFSAPVLYGFCEPGYWERDQHQMAATGGRLRAHPTSEIFQLWMAKVQQHLLETEEIDTDARLSMPV